MVAWLMCRSLGLMSDQQLGGLRPRGLGSTLHCTGRTSTHGWTDTYDITGADVLQVINWAHNQAGDSLTDAVALGWDDNAREALNPGRGRGLIWLVGADGNTSLFAEREADPLRPLARRVELVVVPSAHQIPAGVLDTYNDGIESGDADAQPQMPATAAQRRGAPVGCPPDRGHQ